MSPTLTPSPPAADRPRAREGTSPAPVAVPVALSSSVERALARQRELTPVERFARAHDAGDEPAGARWWRDRIPVAPPTPGTQYGFVVDLDACTGCKACVTACHSLNGLDEGEAWRRVGSLHGVGPAGPVVQTVTTACHHCVEPACLAGCPVDAYDKDPVTGIVAHLDDQCIGCSYCTLTCPYEVPQLHHGLGIVRKCDLCADRLAGGEAPACVQGCPNGAIRVEVVAVDELRAATAAATLVPGAPASNLTVPSTRYVSARPPAPDLVAASAHSVVPAAAHPPLAIMLVLTQVAVGAFVLGVGAERAGMALAGWLPLAALATGVLALGASVLHLGRPLLAWRAVLGVGHSWLSREILAFGVFATAAALAAATRWMAAPAGWTATADLAAVVSGVAAVACSAVLYVVTGRAWWRGPATTVRFAVTAALGGGSFVLLAAVAATDPAGPPGPAVAVPAAVVGVAAAVGLALLAWWRRPSPAGADLARTAHLLRGPLAGLVAWRVGLLVTGGLVAPLLATAVTAGGPGGHSTAAAIAVAGVGLLSVVAGELIERHLFFVASAPPRMPGVL